MLRVWERKREREEEKERLFNTSDERKDPVMSSDLRYIEICLLVFLSVFC